MNESSDSSSAIVVLAVVVALVGVGAKVATTGGGSASANGGGVKILPYTTTVIFESEDKKETVNCSGGAACSLATGVKYTYVATADGYRSASGEIVGGNEGELIGGICLVSETDGVSYDWETERNDLISLKNSGKTCLNGTFSELASLNGLLLNEPEDKVFSMELQGENMPSTTEVDEEFDDETEGEDAYEEVF